MHTIIMFWLWPQLTKTKDFITNMSVNHNCLCIWYAYHTFPTWINGLTTKLQWKTFHCVSYTKLQLGNNLNACFFFFFFAIVSILAWNNTVISKTNSLTWKEFGYKHTCQYSLFIAQIPHKRSAWYACMIWLI